MGSAKGPLVPLQTKCSYPQDIRSSPTCVVPGYGAMAIAEALPADGTLGHLEVPFGSHNQASEQVEGKTYNPGGGEVLCVVSRGYDNGFEAKQLIHMENG